MNDLPVFSDCSGMLTEEQLYEIELWKRGTELRPIVESDVWQILLDTLQQYVDKADSDLRSLPPGAPSVVTAHAALSALDQGFRLFKEDIEAAVEASKTVPNVLRNTVQGL